MPRRGTVSSRGRGRDSRDSWLLLTVRLFPTAVALTQVSREAVRRLPSTDAAAREGGLQRGPAIEAGFALRETCVDVSAAWKRRTTATRRNGHYLLLHLTF